MIFTEQDLINAFKAYADNKGWIYFVGNPESNAKILIDYMKEHQESIDEDKLDELATNYADKTFGNYYPQDDEYNEWLGYKCKCGFKAGYRKAKEE